MKDYTKYDFDAIVGAEVELKTSVDNSIIKGVVRSHTKGYSPFIEGENGDIYTPICIKSLTAKIKVEDMSVKQLKRFAKIQIEPSGILDVVIRFKEKRIEIFAGWDEKRCVHLFSEQHSLDEYIDCTEWGWKK